MIVFDLKCEKNHLFEGWFSSEAEYKSQLNNFLLTCPVCGCEKIVKIPSSPNLVLHQSNKNSQNQITTAQKNLASTPNPKDNQAQMMHFARMLLNSTEDVKDKFPEEARKMHYGEIDERPIRGQVTLEQTLELLDEGIDVLPIAPIFKDTLN